MDASVLKGKIPFIFKHGSTRKHLVYSLLYSLCFIYVLCFGKAMWEKMYKSKLGKKGKRKNKYCIRYRILPLTVVVPTVNPWVPLDVSADSTESQMQIAQR